MPSNWEGKWVEGVTDPAVWTSLGRLGLHMRVRLPVEEADNLIERGQVIETSPPNGVPDAATRARLEGEDVES